MPIAVHMEDANTQHYEVPTEFYHLVLGKRLKYRYYAPSPNLSYDHYLSKASGKPEPVDEVE